MRIPSLATLRRLPLLAAIAILALACKKDNSAYHNIPYVNVDYTFSLGTPGAAPLNVVGGHILVDGGYRGIIIYRSSFETYTALERACPHRAEDPCEVVAPDASGLYAECPCCSSRYTLAEGALLSGPSTAGLLRYNAEANGNTIRVYN